MLKRILLLLADTASSGAARDYAFRLAKHSGAEVAGLAGIDLSAIEVRMPGALGVAAFRAKLEEELKAQAAEARQRLRDAFEQQCRDNDIACEWLSFEGDPAETLHFAAETCDLLVSGYDTAFRGEIFESLSEMASKLVKMSPRPVVICPDKLPGSDEILLAYDGSVPALRAMQMFALLGLGAGRRVQVIAIDEDGDAATRRAGGAASYLRSHGMEVVADPIATSAHPGEVLKTEIAQRRIGTLVMGAYGRRGFREMLFGSTTKILVENPPCAVFLYH
jgi:nucleotide-binding universal stress UspA family protein